VTRPKFWPLALLALLFFGPFLIAVILYSGRGAVGGFGQLPNVDRELIENPETMPLVPLTLADGALTEAGWARSRWSLIYAKMPACEGRCEAALTRLHQVYLALGADRDRVQQVFLAPASEARTPAPAEFLIGLLDVPGGADLISVLGTERLEQGRFFVVDPLGNVILSYPDDADQSRLLQDLERLLEVSRIG
jgi:cytochrome oxidase Cu insertion factor (SCO1/SenC/PrrC family)